MNHIINVILYRLSGSVYTYKKDKDSPWVYISYLPEAYIMRRDWAYMRGHQNRKETVEIVKVFKKLGYNIYLQNYMSNRSLPDIIPEIVFGIEPNFIKAAEKYKNSIKVYYGTGSYYEHQNTMIKWMTDYTNSKYCTQIPYRRMVKPHNSAEIADYILQKGSKFIVETYPESLRSKINIIHNGSQIKCLEFGKKYALENHYFCMFGGGFALKGIILLLEYFNAHPNLKLELVGCLEKDFCDAVKSLFTNNIHYHGFVPLDSDIMKTIVSKCNFLIYPTCSEGVPGAVINSAKMGLIPIVSKWGAFDGIEQFGYIMPDCSIDSIDEGLNWSMEMTMEVFEDRSLKIAKYAENTYNIPRFSEQFESFIKRLN